MTYAATATKAAFIIKAWWTPEGSDSARHPTQRPAFLLRLFRPIVVFWAVLDRSISRATASNKRDASSFGSH